MKIHNITTMPNEKEQLESVKWPVWHGKVDDAQKKLRTLIFESPLKQKSALESLINKRCKGKQHMKWSGSTIKRCNHFQ